MKQHHSPTFAYSVIFTLLVCELLFLGLLSLRNLNFPYLWYDESGQFWIAKGLNHDSPPFSKVGNLIDVIRNNQRYNLDPGGFGLLAHFWTKISNHHLWLRILPFLFFVGTCAVNYQLFLATFKQKKLAIIGAFIPFFMPVLFTMGFEFRAYSMEAMGTVCAGLALLELQKKLSIQKLLTWSLVFSVFMTSRYAASMVVFAVSVCILFLIWKSELNTKDKLKALSIYAGPIFATLGLIYVFALSHQNSDLSQLSYLQYLKNNWVLLLRPVNLFYLILLLGNALLLVHPKLKNKIQEIAPLAWFCLILNLCFILASLLGYYPWRVGSKANISNNLILFIFYAIILIQGLQEKSKNFIWVYASIALSIPILSVWGFQSFLYPKQAHSKYPSQDMHVNTHYHFEHIEKPQFQKIYVVSWESPYIRYAYEYGIRKDNQKDAYPHKFHLQKGVPHKHFTNKELLAAWAKQIPNMNELKHYDLLISSEVFNWASKDNSHWKNLDNSRVLWIKNTQSIQK